MTPLRARFAVVLLGSCVFLETCGSSSSSKPPPATVQSMVVGGSLTPLLIAGDTRQLFANLRLADGTFQAVTEQAQWSSSDPRVATVGSAGLVTAVGNGMVAIRATHSSVTGTFTIFVDLVATTPWTLRSTGAGAAIQSITDVVVDPRDDRLYVGSNDGLFLSGDLGATWTPGPAAHPADAFPRALPGIALDPTNYDRVVMARGQTLWMSENRGQSWTSILDVIGSSPMKYLAKVHISTIDGRILVTSRRGAFSAGTPSEFGVYISSDHGASWTFHSFNDNRWQIAWDFAEDPVDGALYTATEIADHPQPYDPPWYRSFDRGVSWQRMPSAVAWHATSHDVDPETRELYVLTEGAGLFRSATQGNSWVRVGTTTIGGNLVRDPLAPARLFAGTIAAGSQPGGAALSRDRGATFAGFGLAGRSCHIALGGGSLRLFAACFQSGLWMTELAPLR